MTDVTGTPSLRADPAAAFAAHMLGPHDTIVARLLAHADATPGRRFVHQTRRGTESELTYANLLSDCLAFAGLYRAHGVRRGDVVLLFVPTQPRMYAAFFGAMLAGGIPSYMPGPSGKQDPSRYWRDHATLMARIEPRCVLIDAALAAGLRDAGLEHGGTTLLTIDDAACCPPLDRADIVLPEPGDIAFLQHSSGTTGLKKGVMLTHRAVSIQTRALGIALRATSDDVIVTWLPVYHDMGLLSSTIMPLMLGQTIVALDPFEWSADPACLFRAIARHRATLTWLPNFAFDHLVNAVGDDETFDLRSMRAFIDCSEPCMATTLARFEARFAGSGVTPEMLQIAYGMAEIVFIATQTRMDRPVTRLTVAEAALRVERVARPPRDGERAVTVLGTGPAIPGVRVDVADPAGALLPDGAVGELLISGDCLFDGYFRQPDVTRERLVAGRLHSRDEGFVWQGEVFVLGRLDDLMIVHGRNFYAAEIEAIVARSGHMKPGRAVAIGVENERTGSHDLVVIAESLLEGGERTALQHHLKTAVFQSLALMPREVRLVPPGWLSKTTSGKINRGLNKARFLEPHSMPAPDRGVPAGAQGR